MVNPNKFQSIQLNKSKSTHVKATMNIGDEKIESLSAVKFLGIEVEDKLNFNNHINTICRSAANQLNALIRLRRFLGVEEKEKRSFRVLLYQIPITVYLYGCCSVSNL